MTLNPILKELGYSKTDKVVIIHADDVALNLATIDAYEELMDLGTISCGSVMAHSSWLPELAKRYKKHPEWDLGVHLAFNGEYETYKWRPLTTSDPASGFVDDNGYFVEDKALVQKIADPVYLAKELDAQIVLAQNLGLDLTHVDTHTGTLWNRRFVDSYIDVYEKFNLLPVLFNPKENVDLLVEFMNIDPEKLQILEDQGFPMVDAVSGPPVEKVYDIDERFALSKQLLSDLEPGKLTHFAFHPMKGTDEALALNRYTGGRIGDYEVFRKPKMKAFLDNEGIQLIGYKEIAQAIERLK